MSAPLDLKDRPLAATLGELQQRVRQSPGDAKLRTFLFQLLAVLGQWERALAQLGVAGDLDPGALAMVQTYREALKCEALRAEIFAGEHTPVVFGEPEPWIALALEALKLSGRGEHAKAAALRAEAFEQAPATSGRIVTTHDAPAGDAPPAGTPFTWLADADSRMGPVFEAVVLGRYWWIPVQRVRRVQIEAPADLRDMVWVPAHFEWANGGEGVALIPARYPGTEAAEDDGLRLARRTEWREVADGAWHGLGQRMLATDAGEYPLLEVRRIDFDAAGPGA